MSHPLQSLNVVSENVARYVDLLAALVQGEISFPEAERLAAERFIKETGMDEEEYRISRFEAESRKRTSGGNIPTKGVGHKTAGAKGHGKATVCVAGSGYGRDSAARLYRVEGGVAAN